MLRTPKLWGSFGPFGPEVSQRVSPRSAPKTGGVRRSVPGGVSGALRAPGSGVSKFKSVPRVLPECPKGVPETPGTLSGHFLDTPELGARRTLETPPGTPSDTAIFGDTLGTLPGSGRRARQTPVAGRGISQFKWLGGSWFFADLRRKLQEPVFLAPHVT